MPWRLRVEATRSTGRVPLMRAAILVVALVACQRGGNDTGPDSNSGDGGIDPTIDATPLPDCDCFAGNGTYCGQAIADHGATNGCSAPGLAAHPGDLYSCTDGAWSVATPCADGCYVAEAGHADGCKFAGVTRKLWIVFGPGAIHRDLSGLFQCLLAKTNFNDLMREYPDGYGLDWGGQVNAGCGENHYACAVSALQGAGFTISDHDVVMIIVHGYCGGDNNARGDGTAIGNMRIRGANIGDCPVAPAQEERVAVHEAFEAAGHWANADCCTGEVSASCPDNGENFCPDCPCSCARYQADGSYGGYTFTCNGKTYLSQLVPTSANREFDPDACAPFAHIQ